MPLILIAKQLGRLGLLGLGLAEPVHGQDGVRSSPERQIAVGIGERLPVLDLEPGQHVAEDPARICCRAAVKAGVTARAQGRHVGDPVEVDGAPCLLGHRDDVVDLDVRVSVTGQKGRARGLAHSAAVVVVDADEVGQLQGALERC